MNNEPIRQFGVIEGGLSDDFPITKTSEKPPHGDDWLRRLSFEDRFLCKPRFSKTCFFDNYGVAQVEDSAYLLYNFQAHAGMSPFLWVDTKKFSRDYEFVTLLPIATEEERRNERNIPVAKSREVHDGHEGPDPSIPAS